MKPVKTIKLKTGRVEVYQDPIPTDYIEEHEARLGKMFFQHRSYQLGDKKHSIDIKTSFEWINGNHPKDVYLLKVYMLDHSGITISATPFNDPWDSGLLGFIYTDKKMIRDYYGVKKVSPKLIKSALEALRGEIEAYDLYLRGEVYGMKRFDDSNEVVDEAWGYYGIEAVEADITQDLRLEVTKC